MSLVHYSNLRAWNDAAVRAFGDIAVDTRNALFEATMDARAWPGVQVVQLSSVPARVRGGRLGGHAGCFVLCNGIGRVQVCQGGRAIHLDQGEVSVLRADRPYEIDFDDTNRMLVVSLPGHEVTRVLQLHEMQRHGRADVALVAALLQRVHSMEASAAAHLDAEALRAAVIGLLRLARPLERPGPGSQRWHRMASLVDSALMDGPVNARTLATALGLSVRSVQSLFERRGTTVGAFVLEQRLQRVAHKLREQPQRSIAGLAYETGFGDLSYFCRSFRQRFGCTAREWRQAN